MLLHMYLWGLSLLVLAILGLRRPKPLFLASALPKLSLIYLLAAGFSLDKSPSLLLAQPRGPD